MARPGRWLLAGAFLLAGASLAVAQGTGPVALSFPADLTPDIQSLPRVADPTPAARRINDQLAALDRDILAWAALCNTAPPSSHVGRAVDVAFAGPVYLSLLMRIETFCPGAAHGERALVPLTFDLATGEVVKWSDMVPAGLQDPELRPFAMDFIIGSSLMTAHYLSRATDLDAGCRAAILADNGGYFRLWPSAVDQGLVLMPSGLAHANQACADPVALPAADLSRLGFPVSLIDSLNDPAPIP